MTGERWQEVKRVLHNALQLEPKERPEYLDRACSTDVLLRQRVEELLEESEAVRSSFLEPSPIQASAGEISGEAAREGLSPVTKARLAMESVQIGTQLGPYRIEDFLGAGGMGEVYRARDTRLHRTVALKVLPRDQFTYPERKRRLLLEARAVSALNHPNMVILYDIANDRGVDFLVMEYVPGKTLKQMITECALTIEEVASYGIQIAQALTVAHGAGIIHRDIKPANIIVTPESQAKVLDFGVAKVLDTIDAAPEAPTQELATTVETTPGAVIGTLSYMSPEQTRAEGLDARSDIFSLGCVLYEAATGRVAFEGSDSRSVIQAIANFDPPAPSSVKPGLPTEFDFIIQRALAKDKEHRYASALEIAQALESLRLGAHVAEISATEREPEVFVGRQTEIRSLQDALLNAIAGSGKIVFLTGEAGMGKSALARAFLSEAKRDHSEVLVGRGACIEQYGAGEAYLPFLETLSGLLSGAHRQRVVAVLRRYAPTWCLQFPAHFGSTTTVEQLQRETIGAGKERMLREFGDATDALAATSPVILLLEDLHWSDPSSVDLLRYLGSRIARQRLMIVCTARPEDVEGSDHSVRNCKRELLAHGVCVEVPLRLLDPEHIAEYLHARFTPNIFQPELAGLIHRKTEGHPLFSASLVQLLSERGDICQSDGVWKLTQPVEDVVVAVPENVRGMIKRKLELLQDEDQQVLQYASIEGEEFSSTILGGLLGINELALEQRLDRLSRGHRLVEIGDEEELPDGALAIKYRFSHALYQNILYEGLLRKQRVSLHRRAGELLIAHYGNHTARVAAVLATHFERGREYDNAIKYLMEAAEVASERYASQAAEDHYSHALSLVEKLPLSEQQRQAIPLLHKRGIVRLALDISGAEGDFNAMQEHARAVGDRQQECRALTALASPLLFFNSSRFDEMRVRAEEALRLAEQIGNAAMRAEAMVGLALRHSVLGEPASAKALFDAAIPIARSASNDRALLTTLMYRGIAYFFQTEFREAEQMLDEASQLASRVRDGVLLRTALFFLGKSRQSLGHISEALATLNEALEMAQRNGDFIIASRAKIGIGSIHRDLEDFQYSGPQETETELARKRRAADIQSGSDPLSYDIDSATGEKTAARGTPPNQERDAWTRWHFSGVRYQAGEAEYWLQEGDLERARENARLLLSNSMRHGPPKYVGVAHKLLAEIAMASGDLSAAERELEAALEPFVQRPAPFVEWKIYAAVGRLHHLRKDAEAAQRAFTQAAEIVHKIASTIDDERLRSTFLTAPCVEEVLRGSLASTGAKAPIA